MNKEVTQIIYTCDKCLKVPKHGSKLWIKQTKPYGTICDKCYVKTHNLKA